MNLLALKTGGLVAIIAVAVLVLLIVLFLSWYISTYNKLIRLRNQYEEAWSTIDVYLKKRYDLIPNVVETVKGYAKHESETFQKITEARAQMGNAGTPEEKIEADKNFTQAIRSFYAVMENYPELKANSNFMDLQNQLKSIEGELANARKYYNATVRVFNTARECFPSSFVANRMKLKRQKLFEVDSAEERQNVKVQF